MLFIIIIKVEKSYLIRKYSMFNIQHTHNTQHISMWTRKWICYLKLLGYRFNKFQTFQTFQTLISYQIIVVAFYSIEFIGMFYIFSYLKVVSVFLLSFLTVFLVFVCRCLEAVKIFMCCIKVNRTLKHVFSLVCELIYSELKHI